MMVDDWWFMVHFKLYWVQIKRAGNACFWAAKPKQTTKTCLVHRHNTMQKAKMGKNNFWHLLTPFWFWFWNVWKHETQKKIKDFYVLFRWCSKYDFMYVGSDRVLLSGSELTVNHRGVKVLTQHSTAPTTRVNKPSQC